MFRNILVGYDGSAHAEPAFAEAIDLAVAGRARLTILTAVPKPHPCAFTGLTAAPATALTAELAADSQRILACARERVPDDVPLTTVLTRDPAAVALRRRAAEGDHDVVVIGSRGRGALCALLLGSVGRDFSRRSPVPVLIVSPERAAAPAPAQAQTRATSMSPPELEPFVGPR